MLAATVDACSAAAWAVVVQLSELQAAVSAGQFDGLESMVQSLLSRCLSLDHVAQSCTPLALATIGWVDRPSPDAVRHDPEPGLAPSRGSPSKTDSTDAASVSDVTLRQEGKLQVSRVLRALDALAACAEVCSNGSLDAVLEAARVLEGRAKILTGGSGSSHPVGASPGAAQSSILQEIDSRVAGARQGGDPQDGFSL